MKSFSLASLILLIVIAALVSSQLVMMRQLADARAEVENVRKKYGYIRVEDEKLTYVSRITIHEEDDANYRLIVPAGSRYMLHLTDATFENDGFPSHPIPTQTISLNGWTDGADVVLSYSISYPAFVLNSKNKAPYIKAPRVVVHTEADKYFDYVPPDWKYTGGKSKTADLQTGPQKTYATDETIEFMWWKDSSTSRGFVLWLEPYATYDARESKKNATEQTDAP